MLRKLCFPPSKGGIIWGGRRNFCARDRWNGEKNGGTAKRRNFPENLQHQQERDNNADDKCCVKAFGAGITQGRGFGSHPDEDPEEDEHKKRVGKLADW